MFSLSIIRSFIDDDSGAVTVDWVVLTGAVVGLGIYVMSIIGGGINTLGQNIVTDMNARNAGYTSTP